MAFADSRLRRWRVGVALSLLVTALGATVPVDGSAQVTRTLVPIGSGYTSTTLQRFAKAAVTRDTTGNVDLLVLPITFATNAYTISKQERKENLVLADTRRSQLESACNAVKLAHQRCRATLVPMLIRDDAFAASNLAMFTNDVDGMYILGGDQVVAMQVVVNSPAEQKMAAAYNAGAVVGGNSAGAAVESRNMIAGYEGNNGPENGLEQGSVDLWLGKPDPEERGLSFGLPNALLDQHVFQRGRIGRLVNAAFDTKLLGIGVDAETGAVIENETRLTDVAGLSAAIVVDGRTYGASGRYAGPTQSLAVRGVATHLIPPGGYGYDLRALRPLVNGVPQAAPSIAGRAFTSLKLPTDYGSLLLSGDLSGSKAGLVSQRFVEASGGANGRIVVLATGYTQFSDAQADAKAYAAAFQSGVTAPVQWFVLDAKADQAAVQQAIAGATGIFLTAPDQSRVLAAFGQSATTIEAVRKKWQSGASLMADHAAAAALGQTLSVDAPPTSSSLEDDSIEDFLIGGVTFQPGLNFVDGLIVEPRLMLDRHWGRLYNALYHNQNQLGVGVDVDTALELTETGAVVHGDRAVVTLDGRYGKFAKGSNGAVGARYVLLDSFIGGDNVAP